MSLKSQLQSDLLEAMKARDEVKLAALRMFKAAVMKHEVSGKGKVEATDEDVLKILKKEVKQRRDSIEQFEKGGRPELADAEHKQLEVLEAYLPEEMSEAQIKEIAQEVIQQTGASGPADMGKVMGAVMQRTAGKADGGVVRALVQEALKK